jgi:Fanconi-associated nuclease 1
MDIAEDSFYFARQDLIEDRLRAIEAGQARAILGAIDEEHRVEVGLIRKGGLIRDC